MKRKFVLGAMTSLCLAICLPGCNKTKTPSKPSDGSKMELTASGLEIDRSGDVPTIEVMSEVAGIPIPRADAKSVSIDMDSPIPVDAGNEAAKGNPTEPVDGGGIIVRMMSEPKTMNPMTESSAVQTYMSDPYLMQGLASQNPETFEFEPMLATRWVAEDSIKLAPDYPGYERFVSLADGDPSPTLELDFPKSEDEKNPTKVVLKTYGPKKQPLGDVWVGLFPTEDNKLAPKNGYHLWSKETGEVEAAGLVPGKYTIKVGHEIYGVSKSTDDDGLSVKAETPGNPLAKIMKDKKSLELTQDEYVDVQRETIYTYFLDPRAKWSDGTPYTSKDLEFGYAVIKNPFVDADSLRGYYADVIRCDAIDTQTVQMQYRQQYFKAFEFTMGLAMYSPPMHFFQKLFQKDDGKELTLEPLSEDEEKSQKKVSAHGAEFGKFFNTDPRYNKKPLGTGPYVIDSWVDGDKLVLKRNPNYWTNKYRGYLDEITFKFITEDVTALSALEAGEIDFLYRMSAEKFHEALKGPPSWFKGKYVKASWYIPVYSYIGWNLNRELFQDRKVRIALALLMDMEEFLQKKVYNDGVLTSGSPYYFSPAYDHNVAALGYDLETAKDLLSEAGWADTDGDGILDRNGKKFEFTFMMSTGSESAKALAAIFQERAKAAGISIKIDRLEWASYLEKVMNKDFDAVTLSWASPIEGDPYQLWHSSGAGEESRSSNHVSFNNPFADELIEQLRVTLDKDERTEIFHTFHRLLDYEQPYMFLYTPKEFGAYNNKYRGVKWFRIRPGFDLTEWYIPRDLQDK